MSGRVAGKRAIVTAAGQGIGRAAAERLLDEGAAVLAVDIDADALAELDGHPSCSVARMDLTDADAVAGPVLPGFAADVLLNFAGYVANGTILDCDDADWAFSFTLNVDAMRRVTRAVLPGMIERGGGSIVNMSSVASSIRGVPNRFAYGATKAAVIGMTKAVAADFLSRGVRCNAICPGTIDTPSLAARMRAGGDYDTVRAAFVARQPIGRLGTPREVADLALHLASDEAAFTTGQCFVIDGGWCI